MRKWIWLTIIALLVTVGVGVNIYINALEPFHEAKSKAEAIALDQTELVNVDDFSIYNGSSSYYVVRGSDSSGEKLIAWIPVDKDLKVIIRKETDGISKEEAIQRLLEKKSPDEIMTVKLGVENRIPLWEIYYRSNNLINYYYVDFETGEWLKDIQNL